MDKSSSDQCQHIDDGSWDLEDEEEMVKPLENQSSNSWDTSSDEGKRETRVEAFEKKSIESEISLSLDEKLEIFDGGDVFSFDTSMKEFLFEVKPEECLIVEDLEEPNDVDVKSMESAWKIPVSIRSESSENEIEIIQRMILKKSKSYPNILQLIHSPKKCKSFGDMTMQINFSPKDVLIEYEGKNNPKVMKLDLQDIVNLGDTGTHFQEIECRTLITKKDKSENEDGQEKSNRVNARVSTKDETSSLPNIAGTSRNRSSHEFQKTTSCTTNRNLLLGKMEKVLTESWILLDEMGKSQPVTITEVNFLLNGRSADAVLQENKEHFIPKSTIVRNANSDVRVGEWNPLVEESLQHYLNEDQGGEECTPRNIRLERKVGNMLLYIQSGINLTSSVRFIPVDTEMIHMWRQSKETMSPMSSEDDARLSNSENITEEASEWENPEISDDVPCAVHKPGPSVRKKTTKQGKVDESEDRTAENGSIIQSLTDEVKQLRMRLEAERYRSSDLEQENHHLRNQLDKCKKGRSSTNSRKNKSEMSEDRDKERDNIRIQDISSSSLLSVEDSNVDRKSYLDDDRKKFKDTLDMKLNDIEEILKSKTRNQRENGRRVEVVQPVLRTIEAKSGSSASVNTYSAEDTTSVAMSERTGSTDSWFRRKTSEKENDIAEVINKLEKENERLVNDNMNLKKKLNEISIELDDYIGSCAVQVPVDDGLHKESLRKQVCNLKLELENLKSLAKNKEQSYKLKDAIVREELAEKSTSLEEWKKSIIAVFQGLDNYRCQLIDNGLITSDLSLELSQPTPKNLLTNVRSLTTNIIEKMTNLLKENLILKRSLQEDGGRNLLSNNMKHLSRENSEDYVSLMSEKSVLESEIKSLRKENDLLLEYQIEHNERLKKATISLREEKTKVESLENAAKLMEIEKGEISQALISCQKEKSLAENNLRMESAKVAELRGECEKRKLEVQRLEAKLLEMMSQSTDINETLVMKDRIINELKSSCSQVKSKESVHREQVQSLNEQLRRLQDEKSALEEELRSTKHFAEESSRGMSEYITHLETLVSNSEENFAKIKEKHNETLKSLSNLKREYEALEKENYSNIKSLNESNKELENSKEIIHSLEKNCNKSEEAKRKALYDLSVIEKSEREKTETLEKVLGQRKILEKEVSTLRIKAESEAKTKDRLLKEQKDNLNEISSLQKEKEKLLQKYRNVKNECNERTKLLKRLDGKLRENFLEYNKRIACLEKNVSNIIDKAIAYKDTFVEKRTEVNAMVRELKEQLDAVYMEKRGLEEEASNFQETVKELQKKINENRNLMMSNSQLSQRPDNERLLFETQPEVSKSEELENRLKDIEMELTEAREKIRQQEEEKNKYEAIITGLENQISRYQVRLEVMLNNISTFGKGMQEPGTDKRETNEKLASLEEKIKELTEELEKKKKRLHELTELIEEHDSAMRKKESECESQKERVIHLKEEIRHMKSQFSQLQEFLNVVNQNVETYQKERDEISEKLSKSLKLIVEERASRQSSEVIFAEKEKMFKDQLEQLQVSLIEKRKDYEILLKAMDEKKSIINKLQEDVKKWKSEVGILKIQMTGLQEQRKKCEGGDEPGDGIAKQTASAELKEIREQNLDLRKSEGVLQTKIVCLEDELRETRLHIKQLEGDLASLKTSKKLLKEMIMSAKEDIQKFKQKGQLLASVANKIERHFDLSQIKSRELLSECKIVH